MNNKNIVKQFEMTPREILEWLETLPPDMLLTKVILATDSNGNLISMDLCADDFDEWMMT